MRLTAHAYPAQQEHFLASGFDAGMSVRHPYIYDPGIQHEPLRNGEGVWGRGSFHFVSLFLLRSFFYGCSSGPVLWVSLWSRVRVLLRGTPSWPIKTLSLAITVPKGHCSKKQSSFPTLILDDTDRIEY